MIQPVRQSMSVMVALGIAAVLLSSVPVPASAAGSLGAISGNVHDGSGVPLTGALVIIAPAAPSAPQHMVLTDYRGVFSFPSLFPGEYSVKVTMPKFLPATKTGIQLSTGGTAILTVNLQTAMDVVRRALAGQKNQSDDVVWTLRSSRSTQPLLHLAAEQNTHEKDGIQDTDYSGNFALYTESVDTPTGVDQGVGSQFSVTLPLDPKSRITVDGLYSDSPSQPKGFGASYDYNPSERRHSAIGIGLKQGLLLSNSSSAASISAARDIQMDYREDFQWTDHLVFSYGASIGRIGALSDQNYMHPQVGVSWVPQRRTTVSFTTTSEAPVMPGDPARGQEYLDRSIYISPAEQHYSHTEVSVSRVLADHTQVVVAWFKDRADMEALFFTSPDGGGVVILDTSHNPSEGGRVYISRHFRSFEAGAGYTVATGASLPSTSALTDLSHQLESHQLQVVTTRLKADVDSTQTELTAVYRWMSSFSASEIDPYQHQVEFNDPNLSLTVAQNLPTWRTFPGKLQAIIDARNLVFGSQNVQLAQSPRFLKGGINIKF